MAKTDEPYRKLIVESYYPASTSGRKGKVHIRPTLTMGKSITRCRMFQKLSDLKLYPIGSQFEITAKLTDREEGGEYIYSSFRWEFKHIK